LKILLINDPGIAVPPQLYGGIERIVYQLANQYSALGSEVTLPFKNYIDMEQYLKTDKIDNLRIGANLKIRRYKTPNNVIKYTL